MIPFIIIIIVGFYFLLDWDDFNPWDDDDPWNPWKWDDR